MYIYLENELVLSAKDIVIIIDYIHLKSSNNFEFYNNEIKIKKINKFKLQKLKKVAVITDSKIYFTSYALSTLMSRGNEYIRISGGSNSNE